MVPGQRANDNLTPDALEPVPVRVAKISWLALFAPPMAAALVCGGGVVLFRALHGADSTAAGAYLLAGGLLVPVLLAVSILRLFTLELRLLPHFLRIGSGFPSVRAEVVALGSVERIAVLRGIGGRLTQSMTLCIMRCGRDPVIIRDLAYDESLVGAIELAAARWRSAEPDIAGAVEHRGRLATG